jgi:RNA polymerase sigma-70 factor, ECF subfamily
VYYSSILRLLEHLGVGHSLLDDTAEEVFWIAARRFRSVSRGGEHAFLCGVTVHVVSDLLRRTRGNVPTLDPLKLPERVAGEPCAAGQLDQHEAHVLLCTALRHLPLELRTVFVLFELEGLSIKEIAALEELPLGTTSLRLRQARKAFQVIAKHLHTTVTERLQPVDDQEALQAGFERQLLAAPRRNALPKGTTAEAWSRFIASTGAIVAFGRLASPHSSVTRPTRNTSLKWLAIGAIAGSLLTMAFGMLLSPYITPSAFASSPVSIMAATGTPN